MAFEPRQVPARNCDAPLLLADSEGTPLWPVWNDDVRAALERLCLLFGGTLHLADHAGPRTAVEPNGNAVNARHVVALHHDAIEPARLYAHLTHRGFAGCTTPEALSSISAQVVVATFDSWSNDLVRWLTAPRGTAAQPGVIVARNEDLLFRQVVLRSAAWRLSRKAAVKTRVVFLPEIPISALDDGCDILLGEHASLDQIAAAIKRSHDGPSVVSLLTHCDGIDAKLSGNAVLCPMLCGDRRYSGYQALRCVATQHCYRTDLPRSAAIAQKRLVAHEALTAAVLIADACTVIPSTDERIAPADSLGSRLIEDCTTGAILCNGEVFVADLARNSELVANICGGRSLGDSAAVFNGGTTGRPLRRRLFLVGDPELRFEPTEAVQISSCDTAFISRPAQAAHSVQADVNFARTVAARMHGVLDARSHGALRRWRNSLDRLERSSPATGAAKWTAEQKPDLHVSALALARAYATNASRFPQNYWLPYCALEDSLDHAACFCCGAKTTAMRAHLNDGGPVRRYEVCPRCGGTRDLPAHGDISLVRVDDAHFRLSAAYMDCPTRSVFFLHAPYPEGRWARVLPRRQSLDVEADFKLPVDRAASAWLMGVFVSWGVQFGFVLAPLSGKLWSQGPSGEIAANCPAEPSELTA